MDEYDKAEFLFYLKKKGMEIPSTMEFHFPIEMGGDSDEEDLCEDCKNVRHCMIKCLMCEVPLCKECAFQCVTKEEQFFCFKCVESNRCVDCGLVLGSSISNCEACNSAVCLNCARNGFCYDCFKEIEEITMFDIGDNTSGSDSGSIKNCSR